MGNAPVGIGAVVLVTPIAIPLFGNGLKYLRKLYENRRRGTRKIRKYSSTDLGPPYHGLCWVRAYRCRGAAGLWLTQGGLQWIDGDTSKLPIVITTL